MRIQEEKHGPMNAEPWPVMKDFLDPPFQESDI